MVKKGYLRSLRYNALKIVGKWSHNHESARALSSLNPLLGPELVRELQDKSATGPTLYACPSIEIRNGLYTLNHKDPIYGCYRMGVSSQLVNSNTPSCCISRVRHHGGIDTSMAFTP